VSFGPDTGHIVRGGQDLLTCLRTHLPRITHLHLKDAKADNTWAPLALETDAPMGFASPYAQVVYCAKYGVLVNVGSPSRGTAVMRPDFTRLRW